MTDKPAQDDLQFVAAAIRRDQPHDAAAIYFLWAVIAPIGFALADLAPQHAGTFWAIAGPTGGLASFWLGMRSEQQAGRRNDNDGWRQGLHWGLAAVAMFLYAGQQMFHGDAVSPGSSAAGFLLLIGLAYALAGVHLNRGLLPTGLAMLAGYFLIAIVALPWAWTLTGVACGVSLFVGGWRARRA